MCKLQISQLDVLIGAKIRHFRKKMGWGLKLLSYKLNISIPQLQKYEKGINKVSASLLYNIAQIFEISIENFFDNYIDPATLKETINILLIEDNIEDEIVIRQSISECSGKLDLYTITNASGVEEFFKNINNPNGHNAKPDLILLEWYLPKISGLEIIHAIKKNSSLSHIPIVILTNATNPQDILQSYNLHASGVVIKSCDPEAFKLQIHNILSYWTETVVLHKNAV